MKAIPIIVAMLILLALGSIAGCAATPEDRWYQQREALNAANRAYLAHVPLMSDEQIVYHGELLQAARASLEQARQHLPDGGPAFDSTLDIVEALLARVIALETDRGSATPTPAPDVPAPEPETLNTEDTSDDPF